VQRGADGHRIDTPARAAHVMLPMVSVAVVVGLNIHD
jgi:hypothetical protein